MQATHIVRLAIREKFKIKGFIPVDPLITNTKSGRKKATTLSGAEARFYKSFRIEPVSPLVFRISYI
jgi:hypothetical protein